MVVRKNLKKKFALISVFEKKNLKYLCSNLNKFNYSFISTGSTGNDKSKCWSEPTSTRAWGQDDGSLHKQTASN